MKKSTIKLAMYLNYFVFAILLNSVGIVILKAQKNYGVDEFQASVLEAYKDLPIAIVSFLIASFLPRIGYKKAMLIGLALVSAACVSMYYGNSFGTAKLLFATVGVSFALIKVSVYSLIGTITTNQHEHNSLMSSIEGVFMIGIALAYFLFPAFNSDANPDAWLNVYWLLAGISLLSFGFLFFTKFENKIEIPGVDLADDFKQMFKLFAKLLTIVFVISAFLFVMIEQGIMSWLPTFNNKVLHLPENISIMMASILAISLAVGRLVAGVITKRVNWIWVLSFCIIAAMLIVIFVLPKTVGLNVKEINSLSDIPLIGFAFPLVGLFIAPIYPLLNSVVLSALPKKLHSSMTGLIVVFSALGGTLGSRVIGYLFKNEGPENAFYYTLIPMSLLLVSFFILKKLTAKQ
ncbi:MFS transporter [Flavobacterium sp. ZB4P23]|uniref:MFS transporter n=1 Tax=Flavobacterium bomense TaxID=2497483 RepID=A0A432CJW7_9FLAO|nr:MULTISPECIES: MFS transporter [Flavobacterium]RTY83068.1 MFS transporter [Flavobacterium sp. ZB4P23]RTY92942.1 MFS transporter [Flavobacterium sp. RSP46]RTZ03185.1 MFS transporter [Flavobacterium bomense]RTZ08445.1 MFS transporter [Flavobacterium sp. GSP6]